MDNYSKTGVKLYSTMYYEEFYRTYFILDYKRSVGDSTFNNMVTSLEKHFSFFFKVRLKDINAPLMKQW